MNANRSFFSLRGRQCLSAARLLVFLSVSAILWPCNVAGQQSSVHKLTLTQVEDLVSHHVPDSTMRTEIQRRGLAFAANAATIELLRLKGAGPLTLDAIEACFSKATRNTATGKAVLGNSGLYRFNINGKYGFMDRSGNIVITPQFDQANTFSEGLASVKVGTKFGFINTKGEIVITPQFDKASTFSEGLSVVQIGTKFGYINKEGLVVITPQFDKAMNFINGRAPVKLCCDQNWGGEDMKTQHPGNGRYAFIDKAGKYIGPPGFLYVHGNFVNGTGWAGDVTLVRTAVDQCGVLNRSGRVLVVENVSEIGWIDDFTAGLAPARSGANGKWGYLNAKGEWAIKPEFENARGFEDGLASVTVGERQGLIDRYGKLVVNPQFYQVFGVSEGYAIVSSGPSSNQSCSQCWVYGFINTRNQVLLDVKIVQHPNPNGSWSIPVASFSEGLAAVKTDDGWGFIDTAGRTVIVPRFDKVGSFEDGLASVTIHGKETYITKTGAFVLDPFAGK